MEVVCKWSPPLASSSKPKFITEQPLLSMLDNHCTSMRDLRKLHAQIIKTGLIHDTFAASRILAFCASPAGDVHYAFAVFSQIKRLNLFTWNTIIRAFSQSSAPEIAISLFVDMLVCSPIQPERLTYPSVFKAYTQLGLARDGAQLHGRVLKLGLEFDRYVRNTIIHMYASSGFLSEARVVFDREVEFDVVAWNSMVMGLAKCGQIGDARKVFDEMPQRSSVSWNTMISGYVRNGKLVEAVELFGEMQEQRIEPSEFTMVSLLNASASMGALAQGVWFHDYITKNKVDLNPIVVTAIIDMYCKCGCVNEAMEVFGASPNKALSCWNSMIMGLAINGRAEEAMELFSNLESSKFKPDDVSFLSILTACSHAGIVEKASEYLTLMTETYKITPSIKHYSCLVDVLGRAGHVEEAEALIRSMPMEPDAIMLGSLLSACRKHGRNIQIAEMAAKRLAELNPIESSGYVLMSNIYAASGQYEEAIEQRVSMKEKQIGREPGCSLIEVNGEVQEFVAGGKLHPQATDIYLLLDRMSLILQVFG